MKNILISILICCALFTTAFADTEVIVGINNQHMETDNACAAHLKTLAEVSNTFWTTSNPDAEQVEAYLPNVNTPCAYQSSTDVFWVRALMPDSYANSLQDAALQHLSEYSPLIHSIIIMRPTEKVDPETGETISTLPDEPVWTEQVLDEGGQPIGEQTVMVGRFAR